MPTLSHVIVLMRRHVSSNRDAKLLDRHGQMAGRDRNSFDCKGNTKKYLFSIDSRNVTYCTLSTCLASNMTLQV